MIFKNFIVFEGIDGSGTSTQIKRLVDSNPSLFFATAEPTTNETGKFLRRMLCGEFSVDEKTASEDACRIEHYISDKTFDAVKAHMKKYGASTK